VVVGVLSGLRRVSGRTLPSAARGVPAADSARRARVAAAPLPGMPGRSGGGVRVPEWSEGEWAARGEA